MMEQNNVTHARDDVDQIMRSQMEKVVSTYDALMTEVTRGQENTLRDTTVKLAQVKPGDSVLEVGCGTGTLALAAKRQAGPSGKVFGIDVIPGMIELSQRKAAQANEEVTFQAGNIDDIPFSENLFDVVMCSFMIFHMSETTRRKGIAEIYRVLKPQGKLLVLEPQPGETAQEPSGSIPQPDLRELRPLVEASGFSDVEIAPVEIQIEGAPGLVCLRASAWKG